MARVKADKSTGDLFATLQEHAALYKIISPTLNGLFMKDGELYIQCIPSKFMMNSTMIYDIQTRGDVFAVRISDNKLVTFKGSEVADLKLDPKQIHLAVRNT